MGSKILVLGMMILASAPGQDMVVPVKLRGGSEVGSPEVNWAKSTASKIFASAGVRLEWCDSAKKCIDWENRIVVTLEPQAPSTLSRLAMAEAQVFEGRNIRLYRDRIDGTASPSQRPGVLAHVLVHEITHMLQGCDRHSESGIMKARWTAQEYASMATTKLPFEPKDLDLIQTGWAKRRALIELAAR